MPFYQDCQRRRTLQGLIQQNHLILETASTWRVLQSWIVICCWARMQLRTIWPKMLLPSCWKRTATAAHSVWYSMGYTWEMFQKATVQFELATETTTSSTLMGFHIPTQKAAQHFAVCTVGFSKMTQKCYKFLLHTEMRFLKMISLTSLVFMRGSAPPTRGSTPCMIRWWGRACKISIASCCELRRNRTHCTISRSSSNACLHSNSRCCWILFSCLQCEPSGSKY